MPFGESNENQPVYGQNYAAFAGNFLTHGSYPSSLPAPVDSLITGVGFLPSGIQEFPNYHSSNAGELNLQDLFLGAPSEEIRSNEIQANVYSVVPTPQNIHPTDTSFSGVQSPQGFFPYEFLSDADYLAYINNTYTGPSVVNPYHGGQNPYVVYDATAGQDPNEKRGSTTVGKQYLRKYSLLPVPQGLLTDPVSIISDIVNVGGVLFTGAAGIATTYLSIGAGIASGKGSGNYTPLAGGGIKGVDLGVQRIDTGLNAITPADAYLQAQQSKRKIKAPWLL